MAAHFVGLISLERKLFGKLLTKAEQKAGFALLKYYLLAHNIDTLIPYWNDMEQQMEEKKIQQSFFWMISQILLTQFYKRVLKWEYRSVIDTAEWKPFREAVKLKTEQIQKTANTYTKDIKDFDTSKKEWAIEQLTTL
jgi:Rps23 Pro-64 3,4-dihydroxylase Tpa1-like proline 4-hydroxylase